jgi:glycosyltransferase involved in cell wall biosynthesis
MLYPRRDILGALHEFQPEVIHSHDTLQVGLVGLTYARRTGIPITTTIHQLPWFIGKMLPNTFGIRCQIENLIWNYARWILRGHTAIVTPTHTISNLIKVKTGLKTQVISYGIDLATFHPTLTLRREAALRKELALPAGAPVILHVGQLHTTKRVDITVKAAIRVLQHSNAYLLVIGDGPYKQELIRISRESGLSERCHFTGFITAAEGLPEIYRLASLFVTASEIETQGIVLLEAAASGLPIVAARATCIPEIVHHGVNGYLTEPKDVNALAEAIKYLLLDPAKAREMGKAGRVMVKQHDVQDTFDRYENLYIDLIQRKAIQCGTKKGCAHGLQERAKERLNT